MRTQAVKVNCNYCNNNIFEIIIENNEYGIVQCSECKLCYLNPRPTTSNILKIYDSGYFKAGLAASGYSSYHLLEKDLVKEANKRLEIIKKYVIKGRLLDIGCSYGHFLSIAKKSGFEVIGLDISQEAIKQLKKRYSIKGKVGNIEQLVSNQSKYNVITAWDVVEHFPDPDKSFRAISELQNKGDYLFITTPNIESYDAKILGRYWYGFKRIPEHLYYFSPETISNYLERYGYEVLYIRQWGFNRSLSYFVDQIARYNNNLYQLSRRLINFLGINNFSLFFPIIDMYVTARRK